ncbi:MAG: ABC transporter ATP-binding protein, partial [Burkholderiales bacterium]|nr:ABC transporter ATP-binding protein [Burkholderiales bacterium]
MFRRFESLVHPYPDVLPPPPPPPRQFFAFLWRCTEGVRPFLLALTLLTAAIGAFEALLFAMLAHVVDVLARVEPARLWQQYGNQMLLLAGVLVASIGLVWAQALIKYQAVFGNFPMRLRWNFHRLMLEQSMSFFQDEFAGRIATKVMQTALAVRDTWLVCADILVYVLIYFATIVAVVGRMDAWLMLPFAGWLLLYGVALWYFVPRLGRVARAQADARSLMTGRVTDAYTNIATVKLFSHSHREAHFARAAMQEFMVTAYGQMRLVTGFEVANQALSVALVIATVGATLALWMGGQIGVGAVAAASAMALLLNGISHWVMWEMSSLFEHIGTVQDGMRTLSRPRSVLDRPGARPLEVSRGELRFEHLGFSYNGSRRVVDDFSLVVRAGEKIGLV